VVQFYNHAKLPNFRSATASNVSLPECGFSITLVAMFKSDHLSMIMLSVNAGVPLLFLVAVVALIFRQMILG
jgi:hypothetical protein